MSSENTLSKPEKTITLFLRSRRRVDREEQSCQVSWVDKQEAPEGVWKVGVKDDMQSPQDMMFLDSPARLNQI